MKRRFFYLCLLLSTMLTIASCGKSEDELPEKPVPGQTTEQLSLSPSSLQFTAEGGTKEVSVNASSKDWELASNATSYNWVHIKLINASSFSVTVDVNTLPEPRSATIEFSLGAARASLHITQAGGEAPVVTAYDVKLKPETRPISPELSAMITAFDEAHQVLHFSSKTDADSIPVVGQKLILGNVEGVLSGGLLAKVEKVNKVADGYDVEYSNLGIEDVFEKLDIKNLVIDMSDAQFIDENGNPVRVPPVTRFDIGTCLNFNANHDIDLGKDANGRKRIFNIGIDGKMEIMLDITLDGATPVIVSQTTIDAAATFALQLVLAEAGGNYKVTQIKSLVVKDIGFMAGLVPVLISVGLQIDAVQKPSAKISFEISTKSALPKLTVFAEARGTSITTDSKWENQENTLLENTSIGLKYEGSIQAGFAVGPTVALYRVVGFGVTPTLQLRATASYKQELVGLPDGLKPNDFTWELAHTSLGVDFVTSVMGFAFCGKSRLSTKEIADKAGGMLKKIDDALELAVPIFSRSIIPLVTNKYEAERDGDNIIFSVKVQSTPLLFKKLWVTFEANNAPKPVDPVKAELYITESGYADLMSGEEIWATAIVPLDPNYHYDAHIYMDFGVLEGQYCGSFNDFKVRADETIEAAVRSITTQILRSQSAPWPDCNWEDEKISVYDFNYIEFKEDYDGKILLDIQIPATWPVSFNSSRLVVGETTAIRECERLGRWQITFNSSNEGPADRGLKEVNINEPHCASVTEDRGRIETFKLCSPVGFSSIPTKCKYYTYSGNSLLRGHCYLQSYTELKSLTFENCEGVIEMAFYGKSGSPDDVVMPTLTLKNCPKLESLRLSELNLKNFDFSNIELGSQPTTSVLKLDNCSLGSVTLSNIPNLKQVSLSGNKGEKVKISNNSELTEIKIDGSYAGIEVSDCSKLESLECPKTGISSFTVNNLPSLKTLVCNNNFNLIGRVPAVFDQVRDTRDNKLLYDVRYEYTYDSNGDVANVKDNKYGFYYDGEPARGYHLDADKPTGGGDPGEGGGGSEEGGGLQVEGVWVRIRIARLDDFAPDNSGWMDYEFGNTDGFGNNPGTTVKVSGNHVTCEYLSNTTKTSNDGTVSTTNDKVTLSLDLSNIGGLRNDMATISNVVYNQNYKCERSWEPSSSSTMDYEIVLKSNSVLKMYSSLNKYYWDHTDKGSLMGNWFHCEESDLKFSDIYWHEVEKTYNPWYGEQENVKNATSLLSDDNSMEIKIVYRKP